MVADGEDERSIRGVSVARSHGSIRGASVVSEGGCVSRIHYAGEVFTPEIEPRNRDKYQGSPSFGQ